MKKPHIKKATDKEWCDYFRKKSMENHREVMDLKSKLAESEEGRKHWEDLWKKASISVIGLQAKLAESERKREASEKAWNDALGDEEDLVESLQAKLALANKVVEVARKQKQKAGILRVEYLCKKEMQDAITDYDKALADIEGEDK